MDTYQLNIRNVQLSNNLPRFTAVKNDFKKNLLVNNRLVKILIDTGAKVSVCGCGEQQAKLWGIYDKMKPSFAKLHPYNSTPIKVTSTALCSVSFKNRAVPVEFYVLPGSCDPILDGNKAEQLNAISLDKDDNHIFNPVLMVSSQEKDGEFINNICSILQHYPQNFKGLGKLRNYQVKLYTDNSIKPVAVPPRSVPYHLKGRVSDTIENMLKESVIEERPINDPSPWVSCAVIVPKTDASIRITLEARNVNKAIISTNQAIPKQEDIRAQLAGARYFSKSDFK